MARKVEVTLVDDIDGGQAGETLGFSLDGVSYEIDVSSKRADELRASRWPFINKARKVGRGGVGVQRRSVVRTLGQLTRDATVPERCGKAVTCQAGP
jgi:hypothetical protein